MNGTEKQGSWQRRIMLFFVSQCISLFGSQIVQMAIVWHVTLETGSGAWVAVFSLCAYLPQFFVSFLGGVWADRYSRKLLIIGADMLIAAVTFVMMWIMPGIASRAVLLAALLGMSVIRSAGAGIQSPAVNASVAQFVPQEQLLRYNGINAAMQSVVQFAAPAAAAVILTNYTLCATLMIDVITAMLGIGLIVCLRFSGRKKVQNVPPVFSDMRAGIRYAHACAPLRKILLVYGAFVFLTVPAGYLSGLLVSRVYGDTYWYLTAVELVGFGGMMAGGLLMSLWGGFKSRRRTLAAGLSLFGVMAAGMGICRSFALYLVFMALYGVALTAVQTTITTMLQKKAEHTMQGRIFGLMSSLYAACYPLGMALFGPMADVLALQGIMAASGAALISIGIMAGRDPDLKEI